MTNTDLFPELPAPIAQALAARGFTELTAVQRAVVEAESAGRDLRVSSQTGSGKTVAIGIALASHFLDAPPESARRSHGDTAAHPRALVIVPTRELAAQVREELRWLFAELPGATVEVVTGGTSILRERIALSRRPAFVVGTPGRLLDHMRNGALACNAIEHVILDEADQMLDMGFKDELDAILEQLPEKRSSHLVSATFPHAVKALADRFQKDPLTLEGTKPGDAHPDIQHIAYTIRRHETYAALVNVLLLAGDSRCLLFVNRRVDATELAEKLAADGFGAAPFSGELPQAQRTRTLAAFRSGLLPILVSTDVAARGIDVPDISTVIHVDPPRNSAAYVHRSGRTGRAGRTGRSIVIVVGAESKKIGRMLQAARIAVSWQSVPRPEQVEKALHKQARKLLFERLAEASPTEAQQMAAKQLLEERDPIEVVAALLEMAKPKPPCEPMEVVGLEPFSDERGGKRDRGGRDARDSRDARGSRGERPGAGGFTTFEVSWGEASGASTPRLLSHVCRRGGLESNQVGAIRVFAQSSTVEVGSDVADAFEARAARPDERDPGITIKRAGAGSGTGARAAALLGEGARAGMGAPTGSEFKRTRPGPKRPPVGEGRPDFADHRGPRKPFKAGRPVREERSGPRSAGPRSAGPHSAGVPGSRGPHGPRELREKSARPHSDSPAGAGRKPAPKHARKGGPKAPFAKSSKPFKPAIDGPPKARRKVGPGGPPKGPKR